LRLIDYLSVPYRLEAETAELPGCIAESAVVEEALCQLERRRIEIIIAMVGEGRPPPVPRPPLRDCDPAWVAKTAGVSRELVALIGRDAVASSH